MPYWLTRAKFATRCDDCRALIAFGGDLVYVSQRFEITIPALSTGGVTTADQDVAPGS